MIELRSEPDSENVAESKRTSARLTREALAAIQLYAQPQRPLAKESPGRHPVGSTARSIPMENLRPSVLPPHGNVKHSYSARKGSAFCICKDASNHTWRRLTPNRPPLRTVRIGTAGWTLPRQHAQHFPEAASHLERCAQGFNCVEVNSSFHRPHQRKTWERWARSTPPDFRFAVKLPKDHHPHRTARKLRCSIAQVLRGGPRSRRQTRPAPRAASTKARIRRITRARLLHHNSRAPSTRSAHRLHRPGAAPCELVYTTGRPPAAQLRYRACRRRPSQGFTARRSSRRLAWPLLLATPRHAAHLLFRVRLSLPSPLRKSTSPLRLRSAVGHLRQHRARTRNRQRTRAHLRPATRSHTSHYEPLTVPGAVPTLFCLRPQNLSRRLL